MIFVAVKRIKTRAMYQVEFLLCAVRDPDEPTWAEGLRIRVFAVWRTSVQEMRFAAFAAASKWLIRSTNRRARGIGL